MAVLNTGRNPYALAHVVKDTHGSWREHLLPDHLRAVADLAKCFADDFSAGDWGALAGIWHDLGKYSAEFQAYIKKASGYDADAHLEGGRVDHSTAGAIHALESLGGCGRVIAYLIAGHHAGLPDWNSSEAMSSLFQRIEQGKAKGLLRRALDGTPPDEILHHARPLSKPPDGSPALWIRMLFSCLVDADFLDTERFMDAGKAGIRASYPALVDLLPLFDRHMLDKAAKAADTPVNGMRNDILRQCRTKAESPPGIFSLSVPTGGGKTLSGMAFALRHAIQYGKHRIIYVIPYTSIIEQTAEIFREIFGADMVVEHHSNLDPEKESPQSRLASENWDAPIIVTTNVQFFESLFASRTSRTRKLHNIVNSVVVLDEAQFLPPGFLQPILNVMQDLTSCYGATFLLSTATQPALQAREQFTHGLKNVRELMGEPDALYDGLRRVSVELPKDLNQTRQWQDIAGELRTHPSVLCIVNRRDDCRDLYRLMPEGAIHLSALMCGEHRSRVIQEIKSRLEKKQPTQVISTQLVEAGVDLDFPMVYRALAGLDSIAQAAGRCNREGNLKDAEGNPAIGRVVVFVPPRSAPHGLLSKAEAATKELLHGGCADPLARRHFEDYFRLLYWNVNSLDEKNILQDLKSGPNLEIQFRSAAAKFQLIDNSLQAPVIVRYGESDKWIATLENNGPQRWLMRKLQRYTVTIPRYRHQRLSAHGDIKEVHRGIFVQAYPGLYHSHLGFLADDEPSFDPNDYVC